MPAVPHPRGTDAATGRQGNPQATTTMLRRQVPGRRGQHEDRGERVKGRELAAQILAESEEADAAEDALFL